MKRNDIVSLTALYLETWPMVVFAIAKVYANKSCNRTITTDAYIRWCLTGKYDKDTEDFCLDILSKRLSLDVILTQKGLHGGKT